ncbi:MAG: B12-binding protein [Magnetococcales bacterium]|nr:B12-binding protein [Magnetococcales bacterium]
MTGIRTPSVSIRSEVKALALPPLVGNPRRVMLATPPGTLEDSYGRMAAAAGELPLLGLALIAGSLRHQAMRCASLDYGALGLGYKQFQRDFQKFQPHVLGITGYVTNMKRCARLAELPELRRFYLWPRRIIPSVLRFGCGSPPRFFF